MERPPARWTDDLKRVAGYGWMRKPKDSIEYGGAGALAWEGLCPILNVRTPQAAMLMAVIKFVFSPR